MPKKDTAAKNAAKNAVKTTEKNEAPVIDIIRGRMPLAIVAMIKFAAADIKDADLAAKYRTTSGKVSDVRKGRNFGYIDEDFKCTADMITQAKEFAGKLSETDSADVIEALDALNVATEDEAKAFAESRKGSRKPRGKDKAEPEVEASAEVEPEAEVEDAGSDELDDLID